MANLCSGMSTWVIRPPMAGWWNRRCWRRALFNGLVQMGENSRSTRVQGLASRLSAEADVQQRLKFRQEHGGGRRQCVWRQLGRFDLIGALGQGISLADIDPPRGAAEERGAHGQGALPQAVKGLVGTGRDEEARYGLRVEFLDQIGEEQ